MGLPVPAKAKSSENWGMGFLLVFFHEDTNNNNNSNSIVDKTSKLFSSSSQSPSSSLKPINSFRRSKSNRLLTRAQSTISICALLFFFTLLLFTLSTFEPSSIPSSRRFLSEKSVKIYTNKPKINTSNNLNSLLSSSCFAKFFNNAAKDHTKNSTTGSSIALQGMGSLYRRGTRAMNDLVVGHVQEHVSDAELHLFLRLLHRSSLTAKADTVLIFSSQASSSGFRSLIREESDSFMTLVRYYTEQVKNGTSREPSFDVTQFLKFGKSEREMAEPLWGKRIRSNYSNPDGGEGGESESTRVSYGSLVSFEASELDPENSLSGFLDHVPMSLRRWACYPMLLGRVRRNFKHVMLLDVKSLLVSGDPLGWVRNRSPESVHLLTKSDTVSSKHSKKNSNKTQSQCPVNSAIIMGGTRGVRRLSNAMLTEIVRASTQHKRKNSVSESGLLTQLVGNEFVLKNINLMTSTEPVLDASSLTGLKPNSRASDYKVIQNSHEMHSVIMKQICSSQVDSSVYRDC